MNTNLVVDVENALLNLLINLFGCIDERLLDIRGRSRRSLHENQSVLAGERLPLLLLHLATRLEIAFVPDQHYHHIRVRMLTGVFQPCRQVVECLATRDVVDQQSASCTAIVASCD